MKILIKTAALLTVFATICCGAVLIRDIYENHNTESSSGADPSADYNIIQLTDYRYENAVPLTGGYVLLNYYEPVKYDGSQKNNVKGGLIKNNDIKLPSLILKKDGTEIFKPGKYIAEYKMWYDEDTEHGGKSYFSYPQSGRGDRFILRDIDTEEFMVSDSEGNFYFISRYEDISPLYDIFLTGIRNTDEGKYICILNSETGKEIYAFPNNAGSYNIFINADNTELMITKSFSNAKNASYEFDIIDKEGTVIANDIIEDPAETENDSKEINLINAVYSLTGKRFYYIVIASGFYKNDLKDPKEYYKGTFDFLGFSRIPVYNKDYFDENIIIKRKNIGGRDYYAVFRKLGKDEAEEDFRPHEKPALFAEESVRSLKNNEILFNEDTCRYKDNISRKDLAVLIYKVYCRAKGFDEGELAKSYDLDYYSFNDTKDSYILMADKLNLMKGTSEKTFSPAAGLTRQEAAVILKNLTDVLGLKPENNYTEFSDSEYFANWAEESIYTLAGIKAPDGKPVMVCLEENKFSPWKLFSREQAYDCLGRIYETAKNS